MKRIVLWVGLWFFACSGDGVKAVDLGDVNTTDAQEQEASTESNGGEGGSERDTESGLGVEDVVTGSETDDSDEASDTTETTDDLETAQSIDTGSDSEEDTQAAQTDDDDTEPQEKAVEVTLKNSQDAVVSYLMDAQYSAWNYFFGDAVPIGRKWSAFGDSVSFHTALRFSDVDIPHGAKIVAAELYLTPLSSVENSRNLWINIYANQSGNCEPFDTGNYESNRPDQRLRTDNYIDHWLVRCNDSCTDLTEYDCEQRKLDCWSKGEEFKVPKELKDIVGEVIALDDWVTGNALCVFLFNAATDEDGSKYKDSRNIIGYSEADASKTPRLRIVYKEQ